MHVKKSALKADPALPSNNWPGKILEGTSLQIETDSNCKESKQCFSQINEYLLLEEGLEIFNICLYTLSPLPYRRKHWSILNMSYAPSSSLGVYPGLSLKGCVFVSKILSWKTRSWKILLQKNTPIKKKKNQNLLPESITFQGDISVSMHIHPVANGKHVGDGVQPHLAAQSPMDPLHTPCPNWGWSMFWNTQKPKQPSKPNSTKNNHFSSLHLKAFLKTLKTTAKVHMHLLGINHLILNQADNSVLQPQAKK